ncbi:MAG TPA: PLDc N-terminal domain-containing protein [Candidatus Eremiobacteraeota bacterium]|nr:MAG: hypothetical protein BWY64_02751 [bacterium ADurb.Bin363]HPZ08021.1 PLDc N-terminal domain-containing protein [Candidatus Eremiobacteraeota bacterium]
MPLSVIADNAAVGGAIAIIFILVYLLFILVMAVIGIGGTILWVLMLIDVATKEFRNPNDKVLWILIIVLTGVIGAIIYYFLIKKANKY